MKLLLRHSTLAVILVTAGSLFPIGSAQAHPFLLGKWVSQEPAGAALMYDFGPGLYKGNWVWTGPLTFFVANCIVSNGTYELRMYSGLQGTIELRDANGVAHGVGIVDFEHRALNFKEVIFRH
jgi:hypothetical protein